MKKRKKFIGLIASCIFIFAAGLFLQSCSDAEKASPAAQKAAASDVAVAAKTDKDRDRHGSPEKEHAEHADEHEGHNHGPTDAVKDEQKHEGNKDEQDSHAGHNHEAAESDLDRPIDEMWAAKCEHGIIHYTCDECRYELGVVKLAPTLFGPESAPGVIASTTVGKQQMPRSFPLTGEVKAHENMTVNISSAVSGIVSKAVVASGQQVAKGDVLLLIDSPDIAEAKGNFRKLLASLELAKKAVQREERLFSKMVSSQVDVETAKAQLSQTVIERANARTKLLNLGLSDEDISALEQAPLDTITGLLTIRAPHSGIVLERAVSNGERIEPGNNLLLLSDLSQIGVWADLKEDDLTRLNGNKQNLSVEVESIASPGKVYKGKIDSISGIMNEQTRTAQARITLNNPDGLLKPGMFVTLRLMLPGGGDALAVPKVAVLADAGRTFVFVHKEGDYWIRRPVTLGATFNDSVEIKDGLSVGQKIIADGSFLLKSDVLRSKMGAGCAD
jgi:cobalt-zinc-cadmium efflux system membrane fusion protein